MFCSSILFFITKNKKTKRLNGFVYSEYYKKISVYGFYKKQFDSSVYINI